MAKHIQTGKEGELLAVDYFSEKGYNVLHRNWRHKHWEVDIIASKNGLLHFIEVKTRTSLKFGYPEEKVGYKKLKYLIDASAEFLYLYPQWKRIQFDVLSLLIKKDGTVEYFLLEDVYL